MVRFLADASLHHAIVTGCLRREPAIDFVSARAAKLDGLSDLDVLALAGAQGRILVTHDVRTMPRHFPAFLATGATSPGVLLVKQRAPIASVIEDLVLRRCHAATYRGSALAKICSRIRAWRNFGVTVSTRWPCKSREHSSSMLTKSRAGTWPD